MPTTLTAWRRRGSWLCTDFFTTNKRTISEKLQRIRASLQEKENHGHLFDDARLVDNYRHWRLPEDFFGSFLHAVNKVQKVDWLTLHIFQNEQLLFRFSSLNLFKELAEEMIARAAPAAGKQKLGLG